LACLTAARKPGSFLVGFVVGVVADAESGEGEGTGLSTILASVMSDEGWSAFGSWV